MLIETERLLIVPLSMEDVPQVWEWRESLSAKADKAMQGILLASDSFEQFRSMFALHWLPGGMCYAVHEKGGGRMAGAWWSVSTFADKGQILDVTCATIFDPALHMKGYAVESGRAIAARLAGMGINRISVYIDASNRAARRVARMMGMIQEGVRVFPGRGILEMWALLMGKDGQAIS